MKLRLQQLIAEGHTKAAIEQLLRITEKPAYSDLREAALLQSARYQEYARGKRDGTSTEEAQGIALARINEALLQLIAELPEVGSGKFRRSWIIGAGAIVVLIIGITLFSQYNFPAFFGAKATNPLQLTIFVHGPDGRENIVLENEGELIVTTGHRRDIMRIGQRGRTIFNEIGEQFLNDTIGLSLKAEDYELAAPDRVYIFTGDPLYVPVRPHRRLGVVQGKVRSRDGSQFLADVLIEVAGEITQTDSLGNFTLKLPNDKWADTYTVYARKDGFLLKEEKYYPKLGEKLDIRLVPKTK